MEHVTLVYREPSFQPNTDWVAVRLMFSGRMVSRSEALPNTIPRYDNTSPAPNLTAFKYIIRLPPAFDSSKQQSHCSEYRCHGFFNKKPAAYAKHNTEVASTIASDEARSYTITQGQD